MLSGPLRGLGVEAALFGEGQYLAGVELSRATDVLRAAADLLIADDPRIISVGIVQHPLGGFALRASRYLENPAHRPELPAISGVPVLYQYQHEQPEPLTRANSRKKFTPQPRGSSPLTSGHDIRNSQTTPRDFGTVSFFVSVNGDPSNRNLLITNNHVLRGQRRNFLAGESVLHPSVNGAIVGTLDQCIDVEAAVYNASPKDQIYNLVDIAAAVVHTSTPVANTVNFSSTTASLRLGETVRILGTVNRNVTTKVLETGQVVRVKYDFGHCWFSDVIRLSPVTKPGDSGAAVVRESNNELVGIVFAGSDLETLAFPITNLAPIWSKLTGNTWDGPPA